MNNLFWPDENSNEQCFAAHIVQCCQQYRSVLLSLNSLQSGVTMLNNIVDNIELWKAIAVLSDKTSFH